MSVHKLGPSQEEHSVALKEKGRAGRRDPHDHGGHDPEGLSTDFSPDTGRRLRKVVVIGGALLGVAFLGVWIDRAVKERGVARETQEAAARLPPVDVVVARPVSSAQHFLLPGQAAAWHASTIFARVSGYVGKWYVDIGDHVSEGQLLASIETPELDAQAMAARAQLQAAQAQVGVRRAEADLARTTYERWRDSPKGVVSEQEREEKRADHDSAVARLKSAEAEVALDEARVRQYSALTQFKQVTAPYSGVINERAIDIGNLVTAGSSSTTTPLYALTQNDPMRVFVDVPQSAAADLMQAGVPVQVQLNDGSNRQYEGHVARTAQALNPQARTLRVEVDIPNKDGQIVPGMYVKVTFALAAKGLVQVPAAALLLRSAGPQVARVGVDGKVTFQDVTIARDDGSLVELGAGVSPGDQLVLNPSSQILGGQAVEIHSVDDGLRTPSRAAEPKR
jgi:RND family efflux transporter MFP subunit